MEVGKMSSLRLFVLLLVLACTISCRDHEEKPSLKKVESEIGLTLPANSRLDKFFESERLWDPEWVAKVFIPASSYEDFKKTLLAKPTDNATVSGALYDSTDWWNPSNIVLTRQYSVPHGAAKIVVSKEGGEYALYIWHAVI
jgi:hypothetical protein